MPVKISLTIFVSILIWSLLLWQHFTAGIPSHYLLHSEDLPEISNAWGALLLPVLAWFLADLHERYDPAPYNMNTLIGFCLAGLYGATIAIAFTNQMTQLTSLSGPGLLVLAAIMRIYQPQYILGFVLAMTFTFGAVLPTGFALIIASLSLFLHKGLYPIVWRLIKK